MTNRLLIALVLFAAFIGAGNRVVNRGAPVASYIIEEYFEGTGTPSGWFGAGSADFDYTTSPLQAAQSLKTAQSTSDYARSTTGHAASEVYGRFKFRRDTSLPGSSQAILTLRDSGFSPLDIIFLQSDGKLTVDLATSTTNALTAGTDYYIWFRYKKGTGSNAIIHVWFSTTSTRPANGTGYDTSVTNRPNTANFDHFITDVGSGVQVYDEFLVATTDVF